MPALLHAFFLPDFAVIDVHDTDGVLCVEAYATPSQRPCPTCGRLSTRVHSRYVRCVHDLPIVEQPVRLLLHACAPLLLR
jgi:transposase